MSNHADKGFLADVHDLFGRNVREKLVVMFGKRIGKRVFLVGWARLNKLTNNHPILPLPSMAVRLQLNEILFWELDEIQTTRRGTSRRASAEHLLRLYIDILCAVFPRT